MKLHICCGTVYLKNYLNIDIQGFVKGEHPETPPNETTFEAYYKFPLRTNPLTKRGNFVIDQQLDLLIPWVWYDGSIEEIVMIQALEHFLPDEVLFIIGEVYRVLEKGGKFIFDFPDIVETVKQYENDFNMLNRLVYCNHKDQYSIHKCAYNKKTFNDVLVLDDRNWESVEFKEVVKHEYPTIGGIAIK